MHFFCRIIDNFIQYGTLQDRRYDFPGSLYTVLTEETVNEVDICQKIQIPPLKKLLKH